MNIEDYKPNSEEQRFFIREHSELSEMTSKIIRAVHSEKRLMALREINPTDTSLLALYLYAIQEKDYETCEVAKILIEERGIDVAKWPSP